MSGDPHQSRFDLGGEPVEPEAGTGDAEGVGDGRPGGADAPGPMPTDAHAEPPPKPAREPDPAAPVEAPPDAANPGPVHPQATPLPDRARRDPAGEMQGPTGPEERPAPVVTEEGEYWFPRRDERDAVPRELRSERWQAWRNAAAWMAAVALVGVAAAALGAHSIAQATDEEVAPPALRRAVDALAEPEALIDLHHEEIAAAAAAAVSPDATVDVPGYAVPGVALTAEEAASGDRTRMRDALLDDSVTLVRAEGRSALAKDGIAPPVSDRLSTAGAVATLLDGLTAENHLRWSGWRTRLAALAVVLGAAVLALPRGFSGVLGLGVVLLAAGALVTGAALALRVVLSLASAEGPLLDEYLRITQELALIPIRNGIVLAAAGAALLVPAALLRALFERSETRELPDAGRR